MRKIFIFFFLFSLLSCSSDQDDNDQDIIDDQITQKFMKVFYNELVKNKNINLALRKTKIIIKEQYKEPNYWAPFVLIQNKI